MTVECFPTCKRPIVGASALSPLQQKLLPLADGTRTGKQLAEAVGSTPNSVSVALTGMRRAGYAVLVRGRPPREIPEPAEKFGPPEPPRNDPSDYVRIRELRIEAGLPWRLVGQMMGNRTASWATTRWASLQKIYDT